MAHEVASPMTAKWRLYPAVFAGRKLTAFDFLESLPQIIHPESRCQSQIPAGNQQAASGPESTEIARTPAGKPRRGASDEAACVGGGHFMRHDNPANPRVL
jgi:hypothetical protein